MTVNRALIAYALAVVMARTAPTTPATETHRLKNLSDTELDLLAEVDHAPFIVAANLSTPHAPHELEHLIELGLIGDPGETGALVTTDAGKATVKARR